MEYREFLPHPLLADTVECYWTVKGSGSSFRTIYPDGCMDIIFNAGDALITRQNGKVEENGARSFVVGNMSGPIETACAQKTDLMGIRFRPGGLSQFTRIPLQHFNDLSLALELTGGGLKFPTDQFFEKHAPERISFLDNVLLEKRNSPGRTPWVACLKKIIASKGTCRIGPLAREMGCSQRHLERKFLEHVGLGPKALCRVLRFREVKERLLQKEHQNLLELSWDLGYNDHSHLTRSFRNFAGIAPSDFVARNFT